MPGGFDRIPRTIVRGFTALLTLALLLSGDWAMRPVTGHQSLLEVQHAYAAEGCGTGSNSSYTMETYEKGGGRYFFTQDTCHANGTATGFRDRANANDFCATRFGTGATLFSLLSLLVEGANALSGLGALFGFAIAGDCGVAREMYNSVANKIQKANQECGTQGISYQMRVRRDVLEVFTFECQPTGDKSLAPDDTAFITAALVQGPEPDSGDACGVSADAPYYTNSWISDEETGYYRDTYTGKTSDGSHNYQQAQWDYNTGEYDIYLGTVTRCTPPPLPTVTPAPTATPSLPPSACDIPNTSPIGDFYSRHKTFIGNAFNYVSENGGGPSYYSFSYETARYLDRTDCPNGNRESTLRNSTGTLRIVITGLQDADTAIGLVYFSPTTGAPSYDDVVGRRFVLTTSGTWY